MFHPPPQRASAFVNAGRVAVILTAFSQLVLFPGFLFPFVTTRNIYFRICVEIALTTVLLFGVRRLRDIKDGDPVLKFLFLFVFALGMSAVFGYAPLHSLFGDFERMGGVWAWLHLFVFYLVLRALMRATDWIILFRFVLLAGVVVVAWGAGEFLPVAIRNPHFQTILSTGSTIGNQGLLAPYLMLSAFLSFWLLAYESKLAWRAYAATCAIVLLFGIAGARNRSSELGLVLGGAAGAVTLFLLHGNRRRLVKTYLVVGGAVFALFIAGVALLDRFAPDLAEHFGGRWEGFISAPVDRSRTLEWNIALHGFRDRPLLGYGPENHQIVSSHHFDPKIYEVLGEEVFDRTHNAWLELLATSGIVGTIAMLGVWLSAALTIRRGLREEHLSAPEAAIFSAALASYAVYLTFWFFDINSVIVWVIILSFISFRSYGALQILSESESRARRTLAARLKTSALVGLIALAAYFHGVVPLITAHDLSVAAGGGPFELRLSAFQRAMNSPAPQTLHTFPLYYRFLRSSSRFATAPGAQAPFRREFDLALQRGMIEAKRSISRNPSDDRSYVDAARFSMLAGSFYADPRYLLLARDELVRATRISPRRPDARVFLSSVYYTLRDSAKARAQLDTAMLFAPEYGGSFFFAARAALERNEPDTAAALLRLSLEKKFPGNDLTFSAAVSALERKGEYLHAAKLGQAYLESQAGPMANWKWRHANDSVVLTPLSDSLANRLPILYLKGGNGIAAIAAATAFGAVRPRIQSTIAAFVNDVRSGATSPWMDNSQLLKPSILAPAPSSTHSKSE